VTRGARILSGAECDRLLEASADAAGSPGAESALPAIPVQRTVGIPPSGDASASPGRRSYQIALKCAPIGGEAREAVGRLPSARSAASPRDDVAGGRAERRAGEGSVGSLRSARHDGYTHLAKEHLRALVDNRAGPTPVRAEMGT
jgi:hypothetical protein